MSCLKHYFLYAMILLLQVEQCAYGELTRSEIARASILEAHLLSLARRSQTAPLSNVLQKSVQSAAEKLHAFGKKDSASGITKRTDDILKQINYEPIGDKRTQTRANPPLKTGSQAPANVPAPINKPVDTNTPATTNAPVPIKVPEVVNPQTTTNVEAQKDANESSVNLPLSVNVPPIHLENLNQGNDVGTSLNDRVKRHLSWLYGNKKAWFNAMPVNSWTEDALSLFVEESTSDCVFTILKDEIIELIKGVAVYYDQVIDLLKQEKPDAIPMWHQRKLEYVTSFINKIITQVYSPCLLQPGRYWDSQASVLTGTWLRTVLSVACYSLEFGMSDQRISSLSNVILQVIKNKYDLENASDSDQYDNVRIIVESKLAQCKDVYNKPKGQSEQQAEQAWQPKNDVPADASSEELPIVGPEEQSFVDYLDQVRVSQSAQGKKLVAKRKEREDESVRLGKVWISSVPENEQPAVISKVKKLYKEALEQQVRPKGLQVWFGKREDITPLLKSFNQNFPSSSEDVEDKVETRENQPEQQVAPVAQPKNDVLVDAPSEKLPIVSPEEQSFVSYLDQVKVSQSAQGEALVKKRKEKEDESVRLAQLWINSVPENEQAAVINKVKELYKKALQQQVRLKGLQGWLGQKEEDITPLLTSFNQNFPLSNENVEVKAQPENKDVEMSNGEKINNYIQSLSDTSNWGATAKTVGDNWINGLSELYKQFPDLFIDEQLRGLLSDQVPSSLQLTDTEKQDAVESIMKRVSGK